MSKRSRILPSNKLFSVFIVLFILGGFFIITSGILYEPAPKFAGNNNSHTHSHTEHSGVKSQQILDLEKSLENNPADYDNLLNLAHLLGNEGFYLEAIKRYEQYLEKNPGIADVIVDKGVCYYNLKNYSKAAEVIESALKIEPKHEIAHLNLGVITLAAGNRDEAHRWWNKLIEINPNSDLAKRAKKFIESL